MYTISIIEDQEFIANAIAQIINEHAEGFMVCSIASNGKDFLDCFPVPNPDIILTDIRMPQMDGIELSEHLQSNFPDIKVIILTGYEDFTYAKKAISLGVCDYLLKPCAKEELLETLEKVANTLDKQREYTAIIHDYNTMFLNNLPSLRQQTIISLMYKYTFTHTLDLKQLHLTHLAGQNLLWIIAIDFDSKSSDTYAETELILFCCCNILIELLSSLSDKELFICNNQIVFIQPLSRFSDDYIRFKLKAACSQMENITHCKVSSYEGCPMDSILECQTAYQAAIFKIPAPAASEANAASTVPPNNTVLELAIKYITHNFQSDITLQDVANNTYVSYTYLSALFTKNLGVNFSVYLTRIRIEKACELLKDPNTRVADIGVQVGYNNYRYFNYVFKKLTGYTPTEFRRAKYAVTYSD